MIDFKRLEEKYGTPLFVFHIDELRKRVQFIKDKFPDISLCYAIKANSFVVKEIIDVVDRLEVCSNGEYEIVKSLAIDKQKVVLSGVYKNEEDILKMFEHKDEVLRYTIESMQQYDMLKRLSEKYKRTVGLLLRLTSGNQFGISEEEIEQIMSDSSSYIQVVGIEYFSGTQKHSIKRLTKEIQYIKEFVEKIEKTYSITLEEIEYGPGLPIFYFQDDMFDEEEFFDSLSSLFQEHFKNKKVILEIGRSLVASCGYYLAKVVDKKTNKNGHFVILDGGINQLVYYGQTMAMKIPYYDVIPKREGKEGYYNLCGSLCTVNDIIVKQLPLFSLEIGDLFVFKNVGAYSVTEGIALFLSHDLPKVVLLEKEKEVLVRDTIETYKINKPNYEKEGVKL